MLRNRVVWVFAALGMAVATLSLAAPAAAPSAATPAFPKPEIQEWTLPNGMGVLFLPVHKVPVVTVQVWVHAGSKDEDQGRRGSAHMFEHIMFKGTDRVRPEEHARLIDRIGGEINAFTTDDVTGFHDTVPKAYLDFAMQLEAERFQHLLFRKETIDTEREVVKEEVRQVENNPIAKAFQRFREMAFTRHPYAWGAGGRIPDLDHTTPEDLQRFYHTFYQPNNALLLVVGDVTREEVEAAAQRHFGAIPKAAEPPRPAQKLAEPEQTALRRETAEPAQIGVIIGGYKIPEARSADTQALEVAARILSQGESSRLHQRIVRRDRLGVVAGMFLFSLEEPGLLLVFSAFLSPEQGAKLQAVLLEEVEKLRQKPVTANELQKAKNQLAAELVFGMQEVSGLAQQLGFSKLLRGDARAWLSDVDKILAVSAKDVQRVAKTYLAPERLTLVEVPPKGAGGAP